MFSGRRRNSTNSSTAGDHTNNLCDRLPILWVCLQATFPLIIKPEYGSCFVKDGLFSVKPVSQSQAVDNNIIIKESTLVQAKADSKPIQVSTTTYT